MSKSGMSKIIKSTYGGKANKEVVPDVYYSRIGSTYVHLISCRGRCYPFKKLLIEDFYQLFIEGKVLFNGSA